MKKADITQNEIVILNVIWNNKTATLRMIMDSICEKTTWSKHTIISFLKRMEQKNLIEIIETSPVKRYKALIPKSKTILKETRSFVKNDDKSKLLGALQTGDHIVKLLRDN